MRLIAFKNLRQSRPYLYQLNSSLYATNVIRTNGFCFHIADRDHTENGKNGKFYQAYIPDKFIIRGRLTSFLYPNVAKDHILVDHILCDSGGYFLSCLQQNIAYCHDKYTTNIRLHIPCLIERTNKKVYWYINYPEQLKERWAGLYYVRSLVLNAWYLLDSLTLYQSNKLLENQEYNAIVVKMLYELYREIILLLDFAWLALFMEFIDEHRLYFSQDQWSDLQFRYLERFDASS